jgi:dTDP-4-dehydrorhamnose 3,5-epimerase
LSGTILDVAVDLRRDQPTYRKAYSLELSAESQKQLLIPRGFAHGFSVISEEAEVLYKSDEYYHPEAEGGIFCNDPELAIDWGLNQQEPIISKKDLALPLCKELTLDF